MNIIDIISCYLGGDDHGIILIRVGAWKSASVKVMSDIDRGCWSTMWTVFKLLKCLLRAEDDAPSPTKPPDMVSIHPRTNFSHSRSRVRLRERRLRLLSFRHGRSRLLREVLPLGGSCSGCFFLHVCLKVARTNKPFYLIFHCGVVLFLWPWFWWKWQLLLSSTFFGEDFLRTVRSSVCRASSSTLALGALRAA